MSTGTQNRPLTPWESLLKTVVEALIDNLPNIIRNGFDEGDVKFPPYTNVQLPDMLRFDTGQPLALCSLIFKPVGSTLLSVRDNRLNGLETITPCGEISFPQQDIQLLVPLLFREISLAGNWGTESQCQKRNDPPITTEHRGTYTVRYTDVQITLEITLDQKASSATAVAMRLTDSNNKWKEQPDLNPAKDMTFGSETSPGQKATLTTLLKTEEVRSKFRNPVKEVIESQALAGEIKKVVNAMLEAF